MKPPEPSLFKKGDEEEKEKKNKQRINQFPSFNQL